MTQGEFEKIFQEHGPLVWSIIRKYRIPGSEAEDLFLEVWEAVWESLDEFSGKSRLSTWIGSFARHKCVDYFRKRRLYQLPETELFRGLENRIPGERSGRKSGPAEGAIRSEVKNLITEALAGLPSLRRTILERWMLGFTYREIAGMINAGGIDPVGTGYIGKNLYLAKKQIAAGLKEVGITRFEEIWE